MKRLGLAAITLIAFAVSEGQAADMAVKAPIMKAPVAAPIYNWSGFYIGGHAGYLWSSTRVTDNGVVVEPNASTNGFVGGALAGFNWQTGNWVLGLEGDGGWSDARGNGVAVAVTPPNRYELEWTAHLRGRLGYAPGQGQLLLFVAGGLAEARFKFIDGETNDRTAKTYTGGSIGGGADYAFSPNVIGRIEYLYDNYSMGSNLIALHDYVAKLKNAQTFRGALSFKFN